MPKGGAGYFATTTSGMSIAHLRSAVCKGFFDALFQNVYDLYSSASEYRGFTTVGDPEMNIWTAIPQPLEVAHVAELSLADDSLLVHVEHEAVPLESALVCVLLDTVVYEYGFTGNDGLVIFNFDTLVEGYMQITVTARNKIPYLDSIPVVLTHIGETKEAKMIMPSHIEISPNPFRHNTNIRYMIHDTGCTTEESRNSNFEMRKNRLDIYDINGRLVRIFYLESCIMDRESVVLWDGTDDTGKGLPAGIYFVSFPSTAARMVPVILLR